MYNSYYGAPNNYNPAQYQQQINQPIQPIQQPTFQSPTLLPGMVVNDISNVGPENVPMNGKPSVFPLSDGSAVYIKTWNPQGGISTIKYVQEASKQDVTQSYSMLLQRIENIEKQLGLDKETT